MALWPSNGLASPEKTALKNVFTILPWIKQRSEDGVLENVKS